VWTINEDRAVLEWTARDAELAELLGRPIRQIWQRRHRLRAAAAKLGLSKFAIETRYLDQLRVLLEPAPRPPARPVRSPPPYFKFCPDCDQGFFTWYNQTKRCPLCAFRRTGPKRLRQQDISAGQKNRMNARRVEWRRKNLDRQREVERERARRSRRANPERIQRNTRRYVARQMGLTLDQYDAFQKERADERLMAEATRLAVAELKARRPAPPRQCRQCGAWFEPQPPRTERRVYCSRDCYDDSVRERSRIVGRAKHGTLPLGQRGDGLCACCGEPFVAYYSTQRYCTPMCRTRAEDQRKNRRRRLKVG
jgi:hypothetical protein